MATNNKNLTFSCDKTNKIFRGITKIGWVNWQQEIQKTDDANYLITVRNFRILRDFDWCNEELENGNLMIAGNVRLGHILKEGILYFVQELINGKLGNFAASGSEKVTIQIEDWNSLFETLRRISVPYYEEARPLLERAKQDEYLAFRLKENWNDPITYIAIRNSAKRGVI
ncbi:hypothetical protein PV783_29325 [Chitinophaga sp. CC14]|uniref:hypothetical protein n=1 Tax=Chitinophaga sp. CC14 TaxID=3029199 RepID=UPI003B7E44D1